MGQHNFQEVMRQWQRMCKSMQEKNMSCKEDCLLGHNPTCGELEYATPEEIKNAETVIMKWAAEHPEPVYPTWWEWLASIGAVTCKVKPDVASELIETGLLDPIPADIAQKLGLEPKGES